MRINNIMIHDVGEGCCWGGGDARRGVEKGGGESDGGELVESEARHVQCVTALINTAND